MLRTLRAGVVPATMILLARCLHVGPDSNSVTLDFNFTVPDVSADWEVGAADFPVGSEADVAESGGGRTPPRPLPPTPPRPGGGGQGGARRRGSRSWRRTPGTSTA